MEASPGAARKPNPSVRLSLGEAGSSKGLRKRPILRSWPPTAAIRPARSSLGIGSWRLPYGRPAERPGCACAAQRRIRAWEAVPRPGTVRGACRWGGDHFQLVWSATGPSACGLWESLDRWPSSTSFAGFSLMACRSRALLDTPRGLPGRPGDGPSLSPWQHRCLWGNLPVPSRLAAQGLNLCWRDVRALPETGERARPRPARWLPSAAPMPGTAGGIVLLTWLATDLLCALSPNRSPYAAGIARPGSGLLGAGARCEVELKAMTWGLAS